MLGEGVAQLEMSTDKVWKQKFLSHRFKFCHLHKGLGSAQMLREFNRSASQRMKMPDENCRNSDVIINLNAIKYVKTVQLCSN